MKRFGGLWERICSLENIEFAHRLARKGKAHYTEVKMVDRDPDKYFMMIRKMLIEKSFINSPYVVMMRTDGLKEREIWKLPYFPDRIIHHCIVNILEPIWIRGFIRDTYSSLPGRGVHDGVKRLRRALTSVDATKYCLKLDVRKFYRSIDHGELKSLIRRKIKDMDVLWLLDLIIDSAPGVPIGNYSSQYFANVYLSDFDHWIKETLRVRYYFRYCDDLVLLGKTKEELHRIRVDINRYLSEQLKLDVKKNWQVFPVDARGIDFLGYRFFHRFTLVRKSIVQRFKEQVKKSEERSLAAYNGWFVWADTYNLRKQYGWV
ncbi:MAG: reverse transcriptase [Chlorobiaceae bacterium]|nr:reverse transcriptase [Chlorobiaceae bacterium]